MTERNKVKVTKPSFRSSHPYKHHIRALTWKCYKQRRRAWLNWAAIMVFALVCMACAVLVSRHVFLQPIEGQDNYRLSARDLLGMLPPDTRLAYAPSNEKTDAVMRLAADALGKSMEKASSPTDLLHRLYDRTSAKKKSSGGVVQSKPLIWVVFRNKPEDKIWMFSIRSTELAKHKKVGHEYYMSSGFLAVQVAVSRAIIQLSGDTPVAFNLSLVNMPVSPLMYKDKVRTTTSWILLFITFAILPSVIDTQALVVRETSNLFKRALYVHGVDYTTMYLGWLAYGAMSGFPVCTSAVVTLLFIFRWIEIFTTMLFVYLYFCVLLCGALIVALFQDKVWVSSVWNCLGITLMTMLAIIMVHYKYDDKPPPVVFLLHLLIPPLGFVHGINRFALVQSGGGFAPRGSQHILWILLTWALIISLYLAILMLLQRTLKTSIGGAKSLKAIFFKNHDKYDDLQGIEVYPDISRTRIQQVDELKALAVSIRYMSKSIKGVEVIKDITMDMYRGEYTMLVADVTQIQVLQTFVDLVTGLTHPDKGTINILGEEVRRQGRALTCAPYMLGVCPEPKSLIGELTVEEHLTLFLDLTLWNQTSEFHDEYSANRRIYLMTECYLGAVREVRVKHLSDYYKAQLCWAIATLLEPRVILVHYIHALRTYSAEFLAVIQDKIRLYRGHRTIIQTTYEIPRMEHADRCFIFDEKKIVFGGSPGNMFQVYGKAYTLMIMLHQTRDHSKLESLVSRQVDGARLRARLGRVLLFDVPVGASERVARLLAVLEEEKHRLDIRTVELSVPDVEDIYKRAIVAFRSSKVHPRELHDLQDAAIRRIQGATKWKRISTNFTNMSQFKAVGWKFMKFYAKHTTSMLITILSCIICGALIGNSLAQLLQQTRMEEDLLEDNLMSLRMNLLTVEARGSPTTLVVRADRSDAALRVARAYTMSEPYMSDDAVNMLRYYLLSSKENLFDFLTLQAIDDPTGYLQKYAYGIDITSNKMGIEVSALYSRLHQDPAAAVRSLARAHMALLRHYTDDGDVSIHVINEPLTLDMITTPGRANSPPLLIQFLLILTISHTTLIPSYEYGMIRHVQMTAANFSPMRYWLTLFLCDLLVYIVLVVLMTSVMLLTLVASAPHGSFAYYELVIIPFVLLIYGFSCIPQSYLFGLWSLRELNSMVFVFVNVVFGETTVLVKLLYEDMLAFFSLFIHFSPQFNIAYAFVQIKNIFHLNNECYIYNQHYNCSSRTFHACCPDSCGVFQECFERKSYLVFKSPQSFGLLTEVCFLLLTALLFAGALLLFEYKCVERAWEYFISEMIYPSHVKYIPAKDTVVAEFYKVKREWDEFVTNRNRKSRETWDTRAALLVRELEKEDYGQTTISNVNFSLEQGHSLALVGDERHGRSRICRTLAGLGCPTSGSALLLQRWSLTHDPFKYCSHVGFSCESCASSPSWLTARETIMFVGHLRGIPKADIALEVMNLIDAFELTEQANTCVKVLKPLERARLNLAVALIGNPDLIIMDEPTIYQDFSICRSLYSILETLRNKGHSVLVGTCCINTSLPLAQKVAIIANGHVKEIDNFHNLLAKYSGGFTVVVKLTQAFEVEVVFQKYFQDILVNDKIDLYVNIQVLEEHLSWVEMFKRMEAIKEKYDNIESYVVSRITLEYIYSQMVQFDLNNPLKPVPSCWQNLRNKPRYPQKIYPTEEMVAELLPLPRTYCIKTISAMPWTILLER